MAKVGLKTLRLRRRCWLDQKANRGARVLGIMLPRLIWH